LHNIIQYWKSCLKRCFQFCEHWSSTLLSCFSCVSAEVHNLQPAGGLECHQYLRPHKELLTLSWTQECWWWVLRTLVSVFSTTQRVRVLVLDPLVGSRSKCSLVAGWDERWTVQAVSVSGLQPECFTRTCASLV